MKVKLSGLSSGITLNFFDDKSFVNLFGYGNSLPNCYGCFASTTLNLIGSEFSGFNANLPISSFDDKGAGEIAETWRGNALAGKIIVWNFRSSNVIPSGKNYSALSFLNALTNDPNEIIEITVNDTYTMNFRFIEETDTEAGVIALKGASPNERAYWSKGKQVITEYVLEQNPLIPMELPQTLLGDPQYPTKLDVISTVVQDTKVTIDGDSNNKWTAFRLNFKDIELFYNNSINQDKTIIIDAEAQTIENEFGVDRFGDVSLITGSTKYITLGVGLNTLELTVNDLTDYNDVIKEIPTDMSISIEYEELTTNAIEIEAEC